MGTDLRRGVGRLMPPSNPQDPVDQLPLGTTCLPQLLTGQAIGETASCSMCESKLDLSDVVFAYACRRINRSHWTVRRLYCWGCCPTRIESGTLSVTEAIVSGRVGTRTDPTARETKLCLTELVVRDYSPPEHK
jgi:hypothetical protein